MGVAYFGLILIHSNSINRYDEVICFSVGSGHSQKEYPLFKTIIIGEISRNRPHYEPFFENKSIDNYLENLSHNEFCGGDIDIQAFVRALNTTVILYRISQQKRVYKAQHEELAIEIAPVCESHYNIWLNKDFLFE